MSKKEEKKYPVIVLDIKGNYRIYTDKSTYLSYDETMIDVEPLAKIINENKDRIIITLNFADLHSLADIY